jgi:hypothetical protein
MLVIAGYVLSLSSGKRLVGKDGVKEHSQKYQIGGIVIFGYLFWLGYKDAVLPLQYLVVIIAALNIIGYLLQVTWLKRWNQMKE